MDDYHHLFQIIIRGIQSKIKEAIAVGCRNAESYIAVFIDQDHQSEFYFHSSAVSITCSDYVDLRC